MMNDDTTDKQFSDALMKRNRERAQKFPRMLTPGGSRAWPDKKVVELVVVEDLAETLLAAAPPHRREIRDVVGRQETNPMTPPDVLARNEHGGLIGIEVGELTDQSLIEINIPTSRARYEAEKKATTHAERLDAVTNNPGVVRIWTPEKIVADVARIVAEKDLKTFQVDVEPYAERWLVIYTAELTLEWGGFEAPLRNATFPPVRQFDYAYVIGGCKPMTQTYAWCQLPLQKLP